MGNLTCQKKFTKFICTILANGMSILTYNYTEKKGFGDGQTVTNLGFCHGFRHLNNTNIRYQHFSMSKPQMAFRNE